MDQPDTRHHVFENHPTYFNIAIEHYISALGADAAVDAAVEESVKGSQAEKQSVLMKEDLKEDLLQFGLNVRRKYEHSMISIVFSAMAAEAFINFYGISHLKKQFVQFDRLQLFVKWCVIPIVITSKSLNRRGAGLQRLHNLIDLRNRLVHYKSVSINIAMEAARQVLAGRSKRKKEDAFQWYMNLLQKNDPTPISINDVRNGIETVRQLVTELVTLDSSVNSKWVDESYKYYNKFITRAKKSGK